MKLVLTEAAINWLNTQGTCIVTPDYAAYSLALPKKYKAILIVDVGEAGRWYLLPSNPLKKLQLSRRQIEKAVQYLRNEGWLEEDLDPFPEYRPGVEIGDHYLIVGDVDLTAKSRQANLPQQEYNDNTTELEQFWRANA